ncbi:zinc-dependent alcohol dehydrogenase [Oceaniglobus trochenteri]|uniref:zinc-dependent alcohol dehydrogenase n=1 Tax=Oceaniglobus trochenteri TaxID=2763260 RepID=UPI001CFF9650|nr:alcohol dehydrogenase catalytic domain-containing protein [Oceaniglobus trochenteri]
MTVDTMQGVTKRSAEMNDVGLQSHPRPTARPGHVILEVAAAGICGTDLHIFRNEYASNPPVILGHEVCGHVAELGEGVDPALSGRRVVAETFFSTCGRCRYCRDGRPNMCGQRKSVGSHVNGAMTSLVEVPVHNLHDVPEPLSDAAASLAEPVACVANSMFGDVSFVEPGDRVLVTGPGAIGQIAAQVARAAGGHVTLRGTPGDAARLAMGRTMGFETSVVGDDLPEGSFDKCVECSGSGHAFGEALGFLVKGGHLMNMGLSGRVSTLALDPICLKELRITSGFASTPRSWRRAMGWLQSGVLDLQPLITDVLPLSEWQTGFDRSFAADGIKFVLDPRLT